jgi:hypothetical protein
MRTAVFEVANAIPLRMAEVKKLIQKAEYYEEKDEEFFNALCRSASVLLVSHIEGFLKDVVSSVCLDLNYFVSDFSKMPESLRREFVHRICYYEGIERKDLDRKIKGLMAFFDQNSVPIDLNLFSNDTVVGKNPSVHAIDKLFVPLGINKIVSCLHTEYYQSVFEGSTRATYRIIRECKANRCRVFAWPYVGFSEFEFQLPPKKGDPYSGDSMWVTFIEDILERRNQIAHGAELKNDESVVSLRRDVDKAEVLITGLMLFACGQVAKKF